MKLQGPPNMKMAARLALRSLLIALAASALAFWAVPAGALSTVDFLASLSSEEAEEFRTWRAAKRDFDQKLDAYWDEVDAKRQARKQKRAAKATFTRDDYVMKQPPTYAGPKLAPALAKKYETFLAEQEKADPQPRKELETVADYLAAAKSVYDFVPERLPEKEFKRRYAMEAHRLGVSKDQVVRIYALETGGIGTYDMQAGIHPIKKTGRAISSALGYAQLLDANSVNELHKSGADFLKRLNASAKLPGLAAERAAALSRKIGCVKKMYANVRAQPFEWSAQQVYAKTPAGMGVHALNIDGDIGPMLQAVKLRGLRDVAEKAGRASLSGGEMELMNLAGPATGLEMMDPAGAKAPTTNFFARRSYYVNKMVIGLTGEGLLAELNRRMDEAVKTPGSIEFAAAFDSVAQGRTAGQ